MTATGIADKDNSIKSSTFLNVIGPESLDIYNILAWATDGDNMKLDKLMEKFKGYCYPRKNLTYERHIFNAKYQQAGENIDSYVTGLIKEKLKELLNKHLTERAHFIWPVMIKMPFLLLNILNDINCDHVRKCVMRSIIFWTKHL